MVERGCGCKVDPDDSKELDVSGILKRIDLMKPDVNFTPIRGRSVVLRARDSGLLREFYAKRFQDEVLRWSDVWPANPTFEEVRLRFEEQEESSKEWRLWIHTFQGKLIGEISLTDIDSLKHRAEFSIVLFDPAYWGQGYGSQAARLFLQDAVKRFDLETIYLFTASANKRAIRSFEKLGFRITERLRLEGAGFVKMEAEA
jgi:diamine N-acetyltransferase